MVVKENPDRKKKNLEEIRYSHNICCTSNLSEMSQQDCLGHSPNYGFNKINSVTLVNERYKERFVSPNAVNYLRVI